MNSRPPVAKSCPLTPALEFTTISAVPPVSTTSGVLYEVTPRGASTFHRTEPVRASSASRYDYVS